MEEWETIKLLRKSRRLKKASKRSFTAGTATLSRQIARSKMSRGYGRKRPVKVKINS